MKILMSLRDGLQVMMQCYMRHAACREPTMRKSQHNRRHFLRGAATGTFRRCSENQSSDHVRKKVSSQTVGESRWLGELLLTRKGKKLGKELG